MQCTSVGRFRSRLGTDLLSIGNQLALSVESQRREVAELGLNFAQLRLEAAIVLVLEMHPRRLEVQTR
jgi:hypothetical protein